MKTTVLMTMLFFSLTAFSQEATTEAAATSIETAPTAETKPMLANGVRFSLVKPFFSLTETLNVVGIVNSTDVDYESAGGLAVGYVHLPANDFGYTAQLAFYEAKMKAARDSLNFARGSVNVAFSTDIGVSALLGLNSMRYINNSNLEALNMQVGFQGGLNFQFNESFSASVQYYEMNSSGLVSAGPSLPAYDKISREIKTTGFEIELGVTF